MTRIIPWKKLLVLVAIGAMSTTKNQHRLCARGRACVAFSQLGQPAKLSKSNTSSVCFACRDRALDRKLEAAQKPKAKARMRHNILRFCKKGVYVNPWATLVCIL